MTFVFSTATSYWQLTANLPSSKNLCTYLVPPLSMHQYSQPSASSCVNHNLFCSDDVPSSVPTEKLSLLSHVFYIIETIHPTFICTSHAAPFLRKLVLWITRLWVHRGKVLSSQRIQPWRKNRSLNYRACNAIHKLTLIMKHGSKKSKENMVQGVEMLWFRWRCQKSLPFWVKPSRTSTLGSGFSK